MNPFSKEAIAIRKALIKEALLATDEAHQAAIRANIALNNATKSATVATRIIGFYT